jgi:hypothetical protein
MSKFIKTILKIFGILLGLSGGVWVLQGLNVLPGSAMSGNPQWVINGMICIVIGAALFWFAGRK